MTMLSAVTHDLSMRHMLLTEWQMVSTREHPKEEERELNTSYKALSIEESLLDLYVENE